jgi:hypothetical protein
VYAVEERFDSKNGGTYLFCPCQGWLAAFRNGNDCRHVKTVRTTHLLNENIFGLPPTPAPEAISLRVPERQERDPHTIGACGIRYKHSREDHEAAALLLGVSQ